MIRSFLRWTIEVKPSSSMRAMSPVWNQIRPSGSARSACGALVRLVPVALHHLRARDAELAGLADAAARACPVSTSTTFMSVSDTGRPIVPGFRIAELRRGVRDRRRLRQAVAFVQRPSDPALELVDHFQRTRRAAAVERGARARGRTRRPSGDSAARRRASARRGSRSGGDRGWRRAPASGSYFGWMICSAPIRRPIIMHTEKA